MVEHLLEFGFLDGERVCVVDISAEPLGLKFHAGTLLSAECICNHKFTVKFACELWWIG